MTITKIEELVKSRFKIYIDNEYCFCLYQKDLSLNHLKEQMEITDTVYQDIYQNTVLRRAKQKAMAILKFMDRTEQELVFKLKQADYSDSVITDTLDYIKNFHYIDDERYTLNYVRFKKDTKSKRQIYAELTQKGIDKRYIDQVFSVEYESEDFAVQKAIAKKTKDVEAMTAEEKTKLIGSLYRKGFQLDLIKKYIN